MGRSSRDSFSLRASVRKRPRLAMAVCLLALVVLWVGYELHTLTLVEFLIRTRIASVFMGIQSLIECSHKPMPKHDSTLVLPLLDHMPKDVLWITMLTPGTMADMNIRQFELHFQSLMLVGKVPPSNVWISRCFEFVQFAFSHFRA